MPRATQDILKSAKSQGMTVVSRLRKNAAGRTVPGLRFRRRCRIGWPPDLVYDRRSDHPGSGGLRIGARPAGTGTFDRVWDRVASFSVIIPTCENAGVVRRTLASVEAAIARHLAGRRDCPGGGAEIVVVDDASRDDTCRVVEDFTRGKDLYRLVRRPRRGNASCSRNAGVRASSGTILFFLDGDDLFLEDHIEVCHRMLEDPSVQYVKTGVRLSDPVHPEWYTKICNSLVINLCIRRAAHDAIGGFPDYHLFSRSGDSLIHEFDICERIEDVLYNRLARRFLTGTVADRETVVYIRYPGNSFDRQYPRFQVSASESSWQMDEVQRLQVQLAEAVLQHHIRKMGQLSRADEWSQPGPS